MSLIIILQNINFLSGCIRYFYIRIRKYINKHIYNTGEEMDLLSLLWKQWISF